MAVVRLLHSATAQRYHFLKTQLPKDMLLQEGLVQVLRERLTTLFTYSLAKMTEGQSTPSPAFPAGGHQPGLLLSSYQLRLGLRTGFRGIWVSGAEAQQAHSGLVLAPHLGWAGGILLHQLLVTRTTHSLRLDA